MAKSTTSRPTAVRKPRVTKSAASAKKAPAVVVEMEMVAPGHGEIALRAFELFLADGARHGRDLQHWLQAESELLQRRLTSAA